MKNALLKIIGQERCKRWLRGIGYDYREWARVVMYERLFAFLRQQDAARLEACEISGGGIWKNSFQFATYTNLAYPDFDVCKDPFPKDYDLIIADQVFEHLTHPHRALQHVYNALRRGGYFIIATPFLLRVHNYPIDCCRWTETGLKYFMQEGGFSADSIVTGSWGNRSCVRANLSKWARRGFLGSLKNEVNYPVVVWAIARKT